MSDTKNLNARMRSYYKDLDRKNWKQYEHQVIHTHSLTFPHYETKIWEHIPEDWLIECGWLTNRRQWRLMKKKHLEITGNSWTFKEYGLDGLAKFNNSFHAIQAKYRSKNRISANELGSFYMVSHKIKQLCPDSSSYLYSTTPMEENFLDIWENEPDQPFYHTILPFKMPEKIHISRQYQNNALAHLKQDWSGVGAFVMPCGTGKTEVFTSYAKDFDKIIIVSPTRILTQQNYKRQCEKLDDSYTTILADCDTDGTLDETIILNEWTQNDKIMLSTTFKSCQDTLSQILFTNTYDSESDYESDGEVDTPDIIQNTLVIVDEAHNLVQHRELWNILKTNCNKLLLVSATPPTVFEDDDEWNVPILFNYSFQQAIEDKIICDYRIHFPYAHDDNEESVIELQELGDKKMLAKCLFMMTGLINTGSKRCILYATSINEANEYYRLIPELFEREHGQTCWTGVITADVNEKNREICLGDFQDNTDKNYYVLCSVRILDEGIDIPKCDSIFISHLGKNPNDIRLVQRLCRANRLDYDGKIANAFIWTEHIEEAYTPFRRLKEEDSVFYEKICVIGGYDTAGEPRKRELKEKCKTDLVKTFQMKCLSYEEIWDLHYQTCRDYRAQGNTITRDTVINGWKAGHWEYHQRRYYKKGKLSQEKIKKLESMKGWVWDIEEQWEQYFQTCREYRAQGNMIIHDTVIEGWKAGTWENTQRTNYRNNNLSEKRKHKLESMKGWVWDTYNEQWERYFQTCRDYRAQGNTITQKTVIGGLNAGQWESVQRQNYNKKILSEERIKKLESMKDWVWKYDYDEQWEKNFQTCCNFLAQGNTITRYTEIKGWKAGAWIGKQRQNYKKLSQEKIQKLESMNGWVWEQDLDGRWEQYYQTCREYRAQGNTITISTVIKGWNAGTWEKTQRKNYKKEKLSQERIDKLESMNGWVWELRKRN